MDKKKICDIAVDITKSGVITGIKTLAEKSFVCSWIKNWYEDYGQVSGERRTTLVENEFTSKFLKLENELGKEKILNTPNLASLFTTTYQSAMTDVSEDKVSFYANTLVNAIRNENIDDVKTHIFLNMLRNFTKLHIDMLYFFQNIEQKIKKQNQNKMYGEVRVNNTNWFSCASKYNPETFNNSNLYDLCYAELVSQKLLKHNNIGISDHINEPYPSKQTTKLGDEFLAFITEQDAKND